MTGRSHVLQMNRPDLLDLHHPSCLCPRRQEVDLQVTAWLPVLALCVQTEKGRVEGGGGCSYIVL